ncbi:hypothetical protein BO78DRAFT_158925 [Aspergillus sclerotiicarbonarius CBS 121057]|uniref:Uncharacterized protein n=1 Tax=Aspergillus sclerotiicarbonarius (strain CBS 121057 / IBT 28362) TaxID=1448318 RepID=A0A319E4C4_ASPSB|nr:hypothetical protein BO78DRAFT_158925 [Aspergillus sclerotiicarbonarius CBS 121057]
MPPFAPRSCQTPRGPSPLPLTSFSAVHVHVHQIKKSIAPREHGIPGARPKEESRCSAISSGIGPSMPLNARLVVRGCSVYVWGGVVPPIRGVVRTLGTGWNSVGASQPALMPHTLLLVVFWPTQATVPWAWLLTGHFDGVRAGRKAPSTISLVDVARVGLVSLTVRNWGKPAFLEISLRLPSCSGKCKEIQLFFFSFLCRLVSRQRRRR